MPRPRPDLWNATVAQLRSGTAQEELSEKLAAAVNAARDTGKQAEITLKLTIKPVGDGQYELRYKINDKLPEFERGATLMFGTPDGNLTREDPDQHKLNLRSAESNHQSGPLRTAEESQ